MKKFIFNNGEIRLESQMRENTDFKTCCLLWGTFDKKTEEPLPFTTKEATGQDLKNERIRLYEISEERAAAEYDDSEDFYICPNTGYMHDFQGEVIDDSDCNEALTG